MRSEARDSFILLIEMDICLALFIYPQKIQNLSTLKILCLLILKKNLVLNSGVYTPRTFRSMLHRCIHIIMLIAADFIRESYRISFGIH